MALNQTFGENPLFCFKVNAKKKKKKEASVPVSLHVRLT